MSEQQPTQAERVKALLTEAKADRLTYKATRTVAATGNLGRGHGGGH